MIEGDFFHNFNIFLFKTDRVSHGQFVSIFKPIDKYREKSYTVLFYRGADKSLARPTSRCILFDGENISFDASLVIYIYIYSTNIPQIMIINGIYETQNLLSL